MTKDILRKHSHVSSFGAIQRDCENTVKRLQEKLQEEVNSAVSCWRAALVAATKAHRNTSNSQHETVSSREKLPCLSFALAHPVVVMEATMTTTAMGATKPPPPLCP